MPHYKDQNNQLHFLDSAKDAEKYLPAGCVEITNAEAEQIRLASVVLPTYRELRSAEYPPMAMYLDGIVKGDQAQVQAYIDACLAVKAKYPKS